MTKGGSVNGERKDKKQAPGYRMEFDGLMRRIREQTRGYPQEALEDIFFY